MQMCISSCQLLVGTVTSLHGLLQIPHLFQVSFLSSGDCSPCFTYNVETKLTDFKNNILKAALGSFSSSVFSTPTGQTFIFYMLNIKVFLKNLRDFHKSSIHRLEELKVL